MSRNRFIALSIVLDALLVNAGYVLAFLIRFGGNLPAFNFGAYLFLAPFITVLYIAGAWTYGLYDPERSDTAWLVARGVAAAVTLGALITTAIAFFGGERTASFARTTILLAWVLDLVLLMGWRLVFLRFGRLKWPVHKVLIVGVNASSVELAEQVAAQGQVGLAGRRPDRPERRVVLDGGSRDRRLPGAGLRRRHRAHRLRDPRQPRHRGEPRRAARTGGVPRARRRGLGARRRGARALRDLHRHRRRHRRRRAAHGDHALHGAALLRGREARASTSSARCSCSSSRAPS